MNSKKVEEYLQLVMNSTFPYKEYSKDTLQKSYFNLVSNDYSKSSNSGLNIVAHYHKSIWRCNVKNYLSPIDAWNEPEIMYKVIENRIKYLKTDELSIFNIRAGLTIAKFAPKVSVFKPATAKYLINKYLNNTSTIFDPCAGFSGRLLGACALNKKYIGQDINSISVRESNELIKDLNLDASVIIKDSLYDSGEYECLFTCPPYGDKENWHQDIEILSADEWIDVCLKNYKCKNYLFVVDKTEKYKDYVVDKIINTSHFGSNEELVILIKKEG